MLSARYMPYQVNYLTSFISLVVLVLVLRFFRVPRRRPFLDDKTITARWIGADYSNELRSIHLFNRATNWEEFRSAASTFISASQNIIYADKEGNIGLQTSGGLPIRAGDHIMIYPGDTTLYDWTGVVPFENLPYS